MRALLIAGLVWLGSVAPVAAQQVAPAPRPTIADGPLSERRVSYTMDVTLDPEARTVRGTERVTWRNPDRVPVDELQFHLYLNAFKNERSTFMRESGGRHRGFSAGGDDAWGGITVDRMALAPASDVLPQPLYTAPQTDLTGAITFIRPDDGNPDDETVIAVKLPRPVAPGETIALDIDFTAKLPRIFARTGWAETEQGNLFFMVAQWFPKLGVYEVPGQRYVPADAPRGRWNTHQFHANSEFYADFGTYDVTMTVPEGYVVGATGVQVAEETAGGQTRLTYRAEDVHDFAWTASPDFLEFTDTWRHVQLRLLIQPHHAGQVQRHFDAAKAALERFDAWVGEYPYTTLTLVDGIGGSNGMEYPTLITCGTTYMLPSWLRLVEVVTVHEFGHQYFYGMLASNEAEEAWLDEGINSYMEARIMDEAYGPGAVIDLPFLKVSDAGMQRLMYTKNAPGRGAIYTRSWEYAFPGDYSKASYAKPATVLFTLENYLGWERMQEVLRTYYARWRFRHPTTRDFIAVVEEVAGEDMDWFFEPYVYGTAVVDYAVASIGSRRTDPPGGAADTAETWYRNEVTLERRRDGTFPQTLYVRFSDGTEETVSWDGTAAWERFTFNRPARLVEAFLDPEDHVRLDVNRLDNRRVSRPDHTLARREQLRFTTRLQQLLYLAAALF
ncbi:M1 family metallopeptidase [Rhodocaloribacter litoris]|uniref:M1 family metallopeptidase n=1 Tax=Rhodocaloribacter litoris TaxID=2558931 RepID=UPI00141F7364|nr:M1 family metallopeptidase [Rhodocaloribacter litoris]QXD16878.1 M1 family metallopeptidase [Rhodocaloribacter litoris]